MEHCRREGTVLLGFTARSDVPRPRCHRRPCARSFLARRSGVVDGVDEREHAAALHTTSVSRSGGPPEAGGEKALDATEILARIVLLLDDAEGRPAVNG